MNIWYVSIKMQRLFVALAESRRLSDSLLLVIANFQNGSTILHRFTCIQRYDFIACIHIKWGHFVRGNGFNSHVFPFNVAKITVAKPTTYSVNTWLCIWPWFPLWHWQSHFASLSLTMLVSDVGYWLCISSSFGRVCECSLASCNIPMSSISTVVLVLNSHIWLAEKGVENCSSNSDFSSSSVICEASMQNQFIGWMRGTQRTGSRSKNEETER